MLSVCCSLSHGIGKWLITYHTFTIARVRSWSRHKSSCLLPESRWWQLLSDNWNEHEYSFVLYRHPSWRRHTPIPCWGPPRVPVSSHPSILGVPLPSKAKPHRRWPWPPTCDLCHPHTSNPTPFLSCGWLRTACSLPGVSYYTLTHADGPNLWRLRHVCAQYGGWVLHVHLIMLNLYIFLPFFFKKSSCVCEIK